MGNLLTNCTNKPRFLLFGANGWIGSKVYALLKSLNVVVVKAESRANDYDAVHAEITRVNPTHVMSFIGRTHGKYNGVEIGTIDYLEKPGKLVENIQDNLYGPIVLASVCKKLDCHFTYLGTGCIFDYDDEHPYYNERTGFKESDKPNFFGSSYSIVKGYTDRVMHELFNDSALNVRIRMPITSEDCSRNFITKITSYDKICSIPNSMTVLDDLLPVMIQYAINNRTGTINLTNPRTISHNEILEMYTEYVDPDFTWSNFSIEEQDQILASKRSNNCLDTSTIEAEHPDIKNIKMAVKDTLIKMKKEREITALEEVYKV
jgi:3,5-epimerase/4-reductase